MSAICNICGGHEFKAGFQGRMANGKEPMCAGCQCVERHRIIRRIYLPLKPLLKDWRALQFAPDRSVDRTWFKSYFGSSYGGANSLDMMATGLDDGAFDIAISNHVLEHVSNDAKALDELMRVVGPRGVVHVNIPSPTYRWATTDWGFADPTKNLHYREYGSDFPQRMAKALDGVSVASVAGFDPVTEVADIVYFFSRSPETLAQMGAVWARQGMPITRLF